jgi:hypothetical protein
MGFHIREGIVAGRNHILDGRNCQDALRHSAFEVGEDSYMVGVVADGCGGGKYSEVGAQLAVQFIPSAVRDLVQQQVAIEAIPTLLYSQCIQLFKDLVDSYPFAEISERIRFVDQHLLFTLIGFLITPEESIVFAAGDGVVVINDEVYLREQNNTPMYIGYHLIDPQYLDRQASTLPTSFDLYNVPTRTLKRLAIGSDAWLQEPLLLGQIWGMKTAAGLQLHLNRWSNAQHFKDDASMIVVERAEASQSTENRSA